MDKTETPQPLCTLRVADSIFHGYVCCARASSPSSVEDVRRTLLAAHPGAAHVPYAYHAASPESESSDDDEAAAGAAAGVDADADDEGCDDDGEPAAGRVGAALLEELRRHNRERSRRKSAARTTRGGTTGTNDDDAVLEADDGDGDGDWGEEEGEDCGGDDGEEVGAAATAIVVVRYFRTRLLGVTCGRLEAVYRRTARLALHRHRTGGRAPFAERFAKAKGGGTKNLYGLAAGDAELILDVVPPSLDDEGGEGGTTVVERLLSELRFESMVGSRNEPLPRLQCLQADLPVVGSARSMKRFAETRNALVPVYRYPGNYAGTEWPTRPWSRTSLAVKLLAEDALRPLYVQRMNHCVANLYADGSDRIDRHSDKDLDLKRDGAIVSVSLGSPRVLELRDREYPHDVARVDLPPGSMFVLGPFTNARFTHAILPSKGGEGASGRRRFRRSGRGATEGAECRVEEGGRISLTFRDVRTFLDVKTQRLFGQGVGSSSGTPILSEDGVITEDSLTRAVQSARDEDGRERRRSMLVAAGIGVVAGCAMSKSSDGSGTVGATAKSDSLRTLHTIATGAISTVSYWYLQRTRDEMRQQREEKEARAFFSKKSASGNKY